jgi:hypothetical protein
VGKRRPSGGWHWQAGGAGRRRRASGSAMARAREAAGGEDIRGAGCARGLTEFYPPRQNIPAPRQADAENVRGQRPGQVPARVAERFGDTNTAEWEALDFAWWSAWRITGADYTEKNKIAKRIRRLYKVLELEGLISSSANQ